MVLSETELEGEGGNRKEKAYCMEGRSVTCLFCFDSLCISQAPKCKGMFWTLSK